MATQIERTDYDFQGTPGSMVVSIGTDGYAAAYAEVLHDDWMRYGWREELFQVAPDKSVQCMYDSLGRIWMTVEYKVLESTPAGYVDVV
jgi:hypothetical protein